jgi:hypothetical protein
MPCLRVNDDSALVRVYEFSQDYSQSSDISEIDTYFLILFVPCVLG